MNEQRKAGDYNVTHSIHIGSKELVLGENMQDKDRNFYLTAEYVSNELFERYDNCIVSSDFTEVAQIFSERLQAQIQKLKKQHKEITVPTEVLTKDMCCPLNYADSIENKVVVIKLEVLRPEHRSSVNQLYIVTGGNGSRGNARGNAVFCTNLYSGENTRFNRNDIQGVIKPSMLPEWAENKIKNNEKLRQQVGKITKQRKVKENNKNKDMER